MAPKTLISRTVVAWTIPPTSPDRFECRCTLEFEPDKPLEMKFRLWHQSLPDHLSDWTVYRGLVAKPFDDPRGAWGVGDVTTSLLPWMDKWMFRARLRFPGGQIVMETQAGDMQSFLAETVEAAPAAADRDWLDDTLSDVALEGAVGVWADHYVCPRCHQIPRSLLAGCADPICAAEDFRAELELDRRIEATDE